jgi:hypothetical protein
MPHCLELDNRPTDGGGVLDLPTCSDLGYDGNTVFILSRMRAEFC